MPAGSKKFAPFVECSPLWPKHDEILLLQTQVAQSFGGVECWTFGDEFPRYSVWCVAVFQLPNIVAQGSSLSGSVVPILSVFIQTFLEGSAG